MLEAKFFRVFKSLIKLFICFLFRLSKNVRNVYADLFFYSINFQLVN